MNVLVTGGAGFIGSHVVDRLLERGDDVWVLDDLSTGKWANLGDHLANPKLRRIQADITEGLFAPMAAAEAEGVQIEGVVHLAALVSVVRSMEEPLADVRTNVRGTVQVLEYARRRGAKKVVFSSSAAVYGDVATVPTPEDAPVAPLSPYGVDKLTGEHFMRMYADVHGVPTSVLRFFNVYGPRQDPSSPYSGVISIFTNRAHGGQPLGIYGDGGQTRDFVYVGDVVNAIVACLDTPESTPPTNVGTGEGTSIETLANTVLEVSKVDLPVTKGPARAGEIRHSVAVVDQLKERFGLSAQVSLAEGLAEIVASLQQR